VWVDCLAVNPKRIEHLPYGALGRTADQGGALISMACSGKKDWLVNDVKTDAIEH
jgi:hypothetical protein